MNDAMKYISKDAIRNIMDEGTSAEDIVKAFTTQLNEVIAEKQKGTQKNKDAEAVVTFLTTYYPVIFDGLTVEMLIKALDDLNDVLTPIAEACDNALHNKETSQKKEPNNFTFEDLLDMFSK